MDDDELMRGLVLMEQRVAANRAAVVVLAELLAQVAGAQRVHDAIVGVGSELPQDDPAFESMRELFVDMAVIVAGHIRLSPSRL